MAPKETAKRLTELGPAELKGRRVRKYYLARARASCCSRAALTPPQEPTSNSQGAWHTGTITGPGEGGKGRPKFVSVEFDNGAQREFGLCARCAAGVWTLRALPASPSARRDAAASVPASNSATLAK